jgi:ribosome biogenesis GTPase
LVVEVLADRATVVTEGGHRITCRFRGRLRRTVGQVLAGDRVEFHAANPVGIIERVLPRTNRLTRPPLANVSQMVAVFSPVHPRGSLELLDRRLVAAELMGLDAVIVVSKRDLWQDTDTWESMLPWRRAYPTVGVSTVEGVGLSRVADLVGEGIAVLSGESGVGKTSLLVQLAPGLARPVGNLSERGDRGRHTTRSVLLMPVGRGWLADTPGFTQLDLPPHDALALRDAFPEWKGAPCRYPDCRHVGEAGCAIPTMLAAGAVDERRYAHYRLFLSEPGPTRN